ncbi:uncharacterized protein [Watersipora subatra]|uniref:uncharacterized protein isoform X2 n=1 Tax=Watersipora subatra TaxID=2589382 RepID=UPI00355C5CA0
MGNCTNTGIPLQTDPLTTLPTFKVAIVGDCKTGKTAVFNRFAKNCYFRDYNPTKTVKIANVIKKLNVPDDLIVSLTLWDTPGRDDIDLSDVYFTSIDAAIVVVDVTSNESMDLAGYWKQQVINTITKYTDMTTCEALKLPILLLGNKFDLVEKSKPSFLDAEENRKELEDENMESDILMIEKKEEWHPPCQQKIADLAEQHGFISGLLVSAKEADGSVREAMQCLLRNLIDAHLEKLRGPSKVKGERRRKKMQMPASGVDTSLRMSGVEMIDCHIRECELPVDKISKMKASYEKTLENFKLQCADGGFIPIENYKKVTLEQCVTALKLEFDEKLVVKETESGMVRLELKSVEQPRGQSARALDSFNKEFSAVCAIIIAESQDLQATLHRLDQKILKSQSEMWEKEREELGKPNSKGSIDLKAVSAAIDHNRVQIAESLLWIEELYKHAERARDKVSTALLW